MAKAIIIFGSTTGNTEVLAQSVASGLEEGELEVTMSNVTTTKVDDLSNFDLIVFGSSTWNGLHEDFEDFYQQMASLSLTGKKAAVFGPGDKENYPDAFCESVDMLEERLKQCGADIVTESLKIDRPLGEEMDEAAKDEAKTWALNMAKSI